jgi:hypothetical protein
MAVTWVVTVLATNGQNTSRHVVSCNREAKYRQHTRRHEVAERPDCHGLSVGRVGGLKNTCSIPYCQCNRIMRAQIRRYDVTGPEVLALQETARQVIALIVRELRYEDESIEEGPTSAMGWALCRGKWTLGLDRIRQSPLANWWASATQFHSLQVVRRLPCGNTSGTSRVIARVTVDRYSEIRARNPMLREFHRPMFDDWPSPVSVAGHAGTTGGHTLESPRRECQSLRPG